MHDDYLNTLDYVDNPIDQSSAANPILSKDGFPRSGFQQVDVDDSGNVGCASTRGKLYYTIADLREDADDALIDRSRQAEIIDQAVATGVSIQSKQK